MERRILIAFVLSFTILYAWSALFPRQPIKQMSNVNQIGPNPIPHQSQYVETPITVPPKEEINVHPEEITKLESSKLLAEFSSQGGTLRTVTIKDYNTTLPVTNVLSVAVSEDKNFHLDFIADDNLVYSHQSGGRKVVKKYRLSPDDYLIHAEIEIQGSGDMAEVKMNGFSLDINRLDKSKIGQQDNSLYEYFFISNEGVYRKEGAIKFSKKEAKRQPAEIEVMGFRDRYFSMIMHPEFKTAEFVVDPIDEKVVHLQTVSTDVAGTGGRGLYSAVIYFGPQKFDLLKQYELGFEKAMVFSNWGWLDALAKGIYTLMHWIHKIIPNWGVCIILISFIIYGSMYPLTLSGMASMKRMQALQPTMNKLREQHKNNPQRLNKEIMELYKEHRVNPLGGCLPLFLQMPVFVALYQVLWRSVDFKGADFLWIKDLAEPDRLFILPYSLPILGNEFNVLPILMMGIMYQQQKLSAKNMVIMDPAQASQQKMMTVVFPVVLGVVFYKFASGLSLYFTTFYLMSTLTQWKMSKSTKVT